MPFIVPANLPAVNILKNEGIRFATQRNDIQKIDKSLKIAVLNLMPEKIETEIHLIRSLSKVEHWLDLHFFATATYRSKNTPGEHLDAFYVTFKDIKEKKFDGLIITGAPVEHIDFEAVNYWPELTEIMNWANTNVTSVFFICWAAQAGLYHHYGVKKFTLPEKMSGIFRHEKINGNIKVAKDFNPYFYAPHSRYTGVCLDDIKKSNDLSLIGYSVDAGVYLVADEKQKRIFATGHSEYDRLRLKREYLRDVAKGLPISVPKNYFPNDDPEKEPEYKWEDHAFALYSNWINYYVANN